MDANDQVLYQQSIRRASHIRSKTMAGHKDLNEEGFLMDAHKSLTRPALVQLASSAMRTIRNSASNASFTLTAYRPDTLQTYASLRQPRYKPATKRLETTTILYPVCLKVAPILTNSILKVRLTWKLRISYEISTKIIHTAIRHLETKAGVSLIRSKMSPQK